MWRLIPGQRAAHSCVSASKFRDVGSSQAGDESWKPIAALQQTAPPLKTSAQESLPPPPPFLDDFGGNAVFFVKAAHLWG